MKDRRKYLAITFGVVFPAIILVWALWNLSSLWQFLLKILKVLNPVIIGLVIAFVLNIPMGFLETRVFRNFKEKKSAICRAVSIALSFLFIAGVLTILILIIIPEVAGSVTSLTASGLNAVNNVYAWVVDLLARFDITLDSTLLTRQDISSITSYIEKALGGATSIINTTWGVASSVISSIASFLIGLFIAVYMLAGKEKILVFFSRLFRAVFPEQACSEIFRIASLINSSFKNFITGQVTEAFVLGILCFLGLTIFRFQYAMTIAAVIGFCALIPIIGAWTGAIFGALLSLSVSPLRALMFLIFLFVLQEIDNNLIYPKIMGQSVGIPGILVLVSVIIGGTLKGIIGMLLAVPVTAVLYTLVKDYVSRRLEVKELRNLGAENDLTAKSGAEESEPGYNHGET